MVRRVRLGLTSVSAARALIVAAAKQGDTEGKDQDEGARYAGASVHDDDAGAWVCPM